MSFIDLSKRKSPGLKSKNKTFRLKKTQPKNAEKNDSLQLFFSAFEDLATSILFRSFSTKFNIKNQTPGGCFLQDHDHFPGFLQ